MVEIPTCSHISPEWAIPGILLLYLKKHKSKKQELHGSGPNAKNCWVALKLAEAAAVIGRNRRRE